MNYLTYKKYVRLFENINIYINKIKLNNKQKNSYIKYCYNSYHYTYAEINKYLFLLRLLKNSETFFQIPLVFLRFLRRKKQNKLISKIILKQKIKARNSLKIDNIIQNVIGIKSINSFVQKIEDKNRNIVIETTNKYSFAQAILSYYDLILVNQYNVSSDVVRDKVVFDVGANLGEFSIYCARLGAKRVYAFEPVSSTFRLLQKQVELNRLQGRVIPINKALGNKNMKSRISWNKLYNGCATIGKKDSNSESISITKLDDFCVKNNVSGVGFIKIDVEGFEENVLLGSADVIGLYKPVLSFSAYHKPSDKHVLPALVRKLRSDYTITLLKRGEEDFYCK